MSEGEWGAGGGGGRKREREALISEEEKREKIWDIFQGGRS